MYILNADINRTSVITEWYSTYWSMHCVSHAFFAPFLDLLLIVQTPFFLDMGQVFTLRGLISFLGASVESRVSKHGRDVADFDRAVVRGGFKVCHTNRSKFPLLKIEKRAKLNENPFLVREELAFLSAQNMLWRPKTLTWGVGEGTFRLFHSLSLLYQAYSCLQGKQMIKACNVLITLWMQNVDLCSCKTE